MFNATYRWLFWSDDLQNTLIALEPTRLEADSDVTAIIPWEENDFRIVAISRIHFKAPFSVTEIPKSFDPIVIEPNKVNFQGYLFNTSLMVGT